ncbi:metal-dependent transcriptional regulator [Candidatus Aciduliprofundum boonei]|uniref:Iron (Metal) dependent repressor, DtxR family n=1 Tax=Aciduliprofundum boonei (strain DSM 19572 / T469) TaxID=439481 RepID=B5IER3_ACIB4|nr:metal-dependent transcriptional regulator [Candidatus Aciduliprofundum boonei]ADD07938.1 iron (metal) dependent repressor, DtxR family [Aciduliprofundum boonei T469]EDY35257.1 transcriptional regulator, MarR family [Aciduliprofundum boonei T469]HII55590.1 metal-dependent transcriptional regulator [Candidatus Aciduliprofundum boonei]
MITEVEGKYIMAIYEAQMNGIVGIGPKKMAEIMNVKRPTAYEVLNKLAGMGYLKKDMGKYTLTEEGMALARRVVRNHRIIETMLYRMGIEADRACTIASRIQVNIEDDVVELICNRLGNPKECPHGRPIPEGVDK